MRRRIGRGLGGVGIVGAIVVLAAGCGSSGSAQVQTVNLSRAADVSAAAAGYKIAVTMRETVPSVGQINVNGTGSVSPASHLGDMTMQMQLPASAGTTALPLRMVLDKTAIYVKLPPVLASKIPGGKPWLYVDLNQAAKAAGIPGFGSLFSSASSLSDPSQQLDYLRATSAGSVKDLGKATVNGVRTTGYHAVVDLAKLPGVVSGAQRGSVEQLVAALKQKGFPTLVPVNVWIDTSHRIRRMQMSLTEPLPNTNESAHIAMTQNFLQYGPQPAPTIPSASQSVNLFSLVHSGSANSTGA
jgi:hypothetical protein